MILRKNMYLSIVVMLILTVGCSGSNAEVEGDSIFNFGTTLGMVSVDDEIFISSGTYEQVNMILIVSGNTGTLIDAGNDLGEANRVITFIENNNITIENIIITHRHSDHVQNIGMFETEETNLYDYDNTEDGQVIEMGKHMMQILHTPGHADDKHISVELNDNILIAGDIITSNLDPLIVLKYGGNKEALLETLERLKQRNYELIIPGHGIIVEGSTIIDDHIEKLNN